MQRLPILDLSDPRIGVDFFTVRQLGEMNGRGAGGVQVQLAELKITPSAQVRIGTRPASLFAAIDLRELNLVHDVPFDPEREAWSSELAVGVVSRPNAFLRMIRSRHGRQVGLGRPATNDELVGAGIVRRLGLRWSFNRAKVADLLLPTYDPVREATTAELLAEFGHFSTVQGLARAMREVVPHRIPELAADGMIVWDRERAAEFFAGRNRAPRNRPEHPPVSVASETVWRDRIGPFALRAPTRRLTVGPDEARWLFGASPAAFRKLVGSSPDSCVPGETGIAIAWVEATLIDRVDLEGLLLLARVVDGVLVVHPELDKTTALLRVTEKAA